MAAPPKPPVRTLPRAPQWLLPFGLVAAVAVAVTVTVLRSAAGTSRNAPIVTGAIRNTVADLQPGAVPPDFRATTFDGRTLRLSGLKGKVVLLNFFASWCGECRLEFPDLEAAWQAHRAAGFEVVAVDAIDGGDGQAFYSEMHATFPALRDSGSGAAPGPIAKAYALGAGLPVSVFIDRAGHVHRLYPGRIDASIIKQELAQLGINSQ